MMPLVQYVFMAAYRDKLLLSMLLTLIVAASVSIFLGSSSIIEQSKFTLVFASSAIRIIGILGLILFCVFFIRRSFDTKEVEYLLSRPVSRLQFIASYAIAFSLMALIMAVLSAAVIYAYAHSYISFDGFFAWSLSLICEYIIIINVAFFFSMVLTSASGSAMATFAFYVLSRMMGQFLGIIDSTKISNTKVNEILEFTVQTVSVIMPRLDLFAQSSWLIYGSDATINTVMIALHSLIFVMLVVIAALSDLIRRHF